ncbi:MAG: CRTAC1 family protein [Longimicrobiales bacterium]
MRLSPFGEVHVAAKLAAPTALVLMLIASGCDGTPAGEVPVDMVARLEGLAASVDPVRNRFANSAMVDAMLALPARETEREALLFQLAVAEQVLYSGRLDEAAEMLSTLLVELERYQRDAPPEARAPESFLASILDFLAIAHLRSGELANCIAGAGPVACTVPVPAAGVHVDPSGAIAAAEVYGRYLEVDPGNLGSRWMLNVAHMMAGTYPDGVPSALLIPPEVFESEHDIGRFENVAGALGVDEIGHVGGGVMDDFDGDGLLDLMSTSWQLRDPIRYHRNRGDGTFEHRTGSAGLEGLWGGGNLVQADYDNDDDLDVFILRGGWLADGQPNSLLMNRGDGTFQDVTEQAGLLDPQYPSQTATWLDYDGDGLLDLFIGNETFGADVHPTQLFRNEGDGTFSDVAAEVGVAVVGIVKGVASGDYDNDGRPDLYVSRTNAPNVLLRNEGPGAGGRWSFSDRTIEAQVSEPVDAFPTWFWDFDNDGWLDIYVAGYRTNFGDIAAEYLGLPHESEVPRLYRNQGDGSFEDVTVEQSLDRIQFAMGSNFGDLDNDGWLDLYLGTGDAYFQALMPNRMFRNGGGQGFQDVTTSGGFGLIEKGHGVAFGDIDQDGDQDVFAVMGGAYEGDLARNVLFQNPGHGNHSLTLRLVGQATNRSAIGARVTVALSDGGVSREVHRMVTSGSSFGGNPLRLDIGLGQSAGSVVVSVWWPTTGMHEEIGPVVVDTEYTIVEGIGITETVARVPFSLAGRGR